MPTARLHTLGLAATADNEPAITLRTQESRDTYKARLEQIIGKFENMPDSRSDVIDLDADKLVIDNGHLRAMQKDRKAVEANLFLGDFVNENGHYDEDSEDELATAQPLSVTKPKNPTGGSAAKEARTPCQKTPETAEVVRTMENMTPALTLPVVAQTPVLVTPNPLLPQAIQTPVPADPTTLLHALYQHTLAMSQVLQQVLPHATPDLQRSAALLNTPVGTSPFTLAMPSTTVAPAPSGPWAYPEFEDITPQPDPTDRIKGALAKNRGSSDPARKRKRRQVTPNRGRLTRRKVISDGEGLQASHTAQSCAQSASPMPRADAAQPPADRISTEDRSSSIARSENMPSSPSRKQQFPTPQSLVHSEASDAMKNPNESQQSEAEAALPPSARVDESGLPSAYDDDTSQGLVVEDEEQVECLSLSPGHVVLPSIEISPRAHVKPHRTESLGRVAVRISRMTVKPQPPGEEEIQAMLAMTTQTEMRTIRSSTDSDSDDLDLVPTGEPSDDKAQAVTPTSRSGAGAGKLIVPSTPQVKREPLSPRPLSLLQAPHLSTPKSAPHPSAEPSTARSTPKLSKYEFARRARAQWKRAGSKAPQSLKPQKSLPEIRKRRWAADEDSDDELA